MNEVRVGVGVVDEMVKERGKRGKEEEDMDAPLRDDVFIFGLGGGDRQIVFTRVGVCVEVEAAERKMSI